MGCRGRVGIGLGVRDVGLAKGGVGLGGVVVRSESEGRAMVFGSGRGREI